MACNTFAELRIKGMCHDFLNKGYCLQPNCKFTHLPPTIKYMDSHCHLDLMATWKPRVKFEEIPQLQNFGGAVSNFCFPQHWDLLDSFQFPNVWSTVGVHPKDAHLFMSNQPRLESLLLDPRVVAVGECGLDRKHGRSVGEMNLQKDVFIQQVLYSSRLGKPLVIHSRDAATEAFEIVRKYLPHTHKIHLHCFTGSEDDMWMWLNYFPNLKIGFTNCITWDKERVKDSVLAVRAAPLERLLLETDAPHFVPGNLDSGWQSTGDSVSMAFSHPGHALCVAKRIADLRKDKIKHVISITTSNCKFVYNI